jgi:hypothetical protein
VAAGRQEKSSRGQSSAEKSSERVENKKINNGAPGVLARPPNFRAARPLVALQLFQLDLPVLFHSHGHE